MYQTWMNKSRLYLKESSDLLKVPDFAWYARQVEKGNAFRRIGDEIYVYARSQQNTRNQLHRRETRFGTRFQTRVLIKIGTRDGYRWKDVVGTDAPVLVSHSSPPWFGHGPRLKVSRLGLGSRFELFSPRLLSKFYFVRDPLPSRSRPFRIVRVISSVGVRTFPNMVFRNPVPNQSSHQGR
ncbi:hypothetical protein AVEN_106607-1 [Araneus ventricosus]|uniref:Uncharacterized protein n=1 Tax=Araneus ventricosus TaxID=182803 RepID=A0A4Y2IVV7_ARAVE|nr:hypothetical protein AVEN_106607-1 [Araneus ventricosus]